MDELALPGNGANPPEDSSESTDAERTLKKIENVTGLVALKVLTPAQGNTMIAGFRTILSHQKPQAANQAGPSARKKMDPKILSLLLTPDQLDWLKENGDADSEE
jgi:hypothetical protein